MKIELTGVFKKIPEGYIGFVEELPGALSAESLQGQDVIRESLPIRAA